MKIIKKYTALIVLCLLTVIFLPMQTMAAGAIDTSEKCTLTVSFPVDEGKASGVDFKIYRVADISSSADFSVAESYKAYPVSPDMYNDSANWRSLAQTLSGYIAADRIQADFTAKTDENAQAVFRDIPVGLYLVTGSIYVLDQISYIPQSFIISIPNNDISGAWNYDICVEVKYDSRALDDVLSFDFLKIWKDGNNAARPQEIEVEVYRNNELYATVILNKSNNWKYRLNDVDRNAVWTVKEKTTAAGYTVNVDQQSDCFVLTNTKDNSNPPTSVTDSRLPQTGLLWWPIPYLLVGGLLMIITGLVCRRGASNES